MEENISRKNFIRVVGYLKENLLEQVKNADGENVIRGSIIIATSELESHKIQFYVKQKNKNGEETEEYANLCELLPHNTISIASYLKENSSANFAVASSMATKVWATGSFDEFTKREGEIETTMILLKGRKGGIRTSNDKSDFVPCATFTTENFLSSIEKEFDEDGKETGRYILQGYVPTYDGGAQKISYVAPVEENVAAFISKTYAKNDTVTLTGDIVSLVEREEGVQPKESRSFGRSYDTQYVTKFIRERRIFGGSQVPIHQGEKGCISLEEMKSRLLKREEKIKAASMTRKNKSNNVNTSSSTSTAFSGEAVYDKNVASFDNQTQNPSRIPSADIDF